jgi:all-trans-nonaprenyl-diphosphate synthase
MTSATSLFAPVEADLRLLTENLKNLVGARHPILYAAAEHLFGAQGKRVRPAIVLLVSRATMPDRDITPRHRRLAEITEMIHTASLVHDDVVDEAEVRRNVPTVNSLFNNRVAWYLANLNNLEVVKLLSEVIKDMAEGEIQQGLNRFDTTLTMEAYLEKTYCKTASLMANSSKAAGVLSGVSDEVAENLYCYGRYLGLAFQIIDDILDFSDLISGNLTAPVLYALEEKPYLEVLIEREFAQPDDIAQAIALVKESKGIERSRTLATEYAELAVQNLTVLKPSAFTQALLDLADYVLSRLY